ncbi:MAG: urease accessory protein UreF [Burkholderiales bacterium]|nr:urease accessory protein UreF [Burkholderiales bacterium]
MTTTAMTTPTDAALLGLIWLASPALPIGGFSYSEGLEGAVDTGLVTDEGSAANWLADQLHLGLARADLAAIAQAIAAWRSGDEPRLAQLNAWVLQTRETSELRQQAEQMGRSLVEWLRTVRPELVEGPARRWASTGSARTEPSLTYPVAFALAASVIAAPARDSLLAFAFGWAENMMQAAIKSVPLGQSAGQRILLRLAAEIPSAVDHALALADDERQAFCPMLAILSSRHETQYSRLFRS